MTGQPACLPAGIKKSFLEEVMRATAWRLSPRHTGPKCYDIFMSQVEAEALGKRWWPLVCNTL